MKKTHFWAIIMLLSVVISCKKSDPTPAPPATVKFMTFTAGSTWNYKLTNNTASTVTNYTITATGNDSTANGRTFKSFANSAGPGEYYNITGSDYYTFRRLQTSFIDTSLEVLYLKDNLDVNGTWEQNILFSVDFFGTSIPLTLKFSNKIAQKGISRTVNGIAYTGVTEVSTTLSLTGSPIPITLTSDIHYFYAPKFGQIENTTKISISGTGITPTNVDQKTELLSSNIL